MDFSYYFGYRAGTGKAGTHPPSKHPRPLSYTHISTSEVLHVLPSAERRKLRCRYCCCCVQATMLDRDMSLLDIVVRHPFFCWLRGKRARASDTDSSSIQNIRGGGGGGGSSKRRNSPPPDPLGAAESKEWDRVLPAPVSKLVITAPVSTCSGSTLSRTASWSEATVGSESDMRTFGRLQQHSAEGAQEDQFQEKSPTPVVRVAQGSFQGVATGVCYSTTAAIPINIPCRLDKNEPNFVLQEVRPLLSGIHSQSKPSLSRAFLACLVPRRGLVCAVPGSCYMKEACFNFVPGPIFLSCPQ